MIIHPDVFSVDGVNRILEIKYSWRLDETQNSATSDGNPKGNKLHARNVCKNQLDQKSISHTTNCKSLKSSVSCLAIAPGETKQISMCMFCLSVFNCLDLKNPGCISSCSSSHDVTWAWKAALSVYFDALALGLAMFAKAMTLLAKIDDMICEFKLFVGRLVF